MVDQLPMFNTFISLYRDIAATRNFSGMFTLRMNGNVRFSTKPGNIFRQFFLTLPKISGASGQGAGQ
jgi:hypothetical protein